LVCVHGGCFSYRSLIGHPYCSLSRHHPIQLNVREMSSVARPDNDFSSGPGHPDTQTPRPNPSEPSPDPDQTQPSHHRPITPRCGPRVSGIALSVSLGYTCVYGRDWCQQSTVSTSSCRTRYVGVCWRLESWVLGKVMIT
jgi:hypothetical protein